ncbi:hypothetical protein [Goodfellowiella coeruleoviolacea]|nr:hypothetical protein [Goodfellowiella coeruleoviolacea]
MLAGPTNWRRRARLLYPLRCNATRTTLSPGYSPNGNALFWEFAYFPAVPRRGRAAWLIGAVLPLTVMALSPTPGLLNADIPVVLGLLLLPVNGFALLLLLSFLITQLLPGRQFWQPGPLPMLALSVVCGIPLVLGAGALHERIDERHQFVRDLVEWVQVLGGGMIGAAALGAFLWMPIAWIMYRSRRIHAVNLDALD